MRSGQRLFTEQFIQQQEAMLRETSRKTGEYTKILNESRIKPILDYMERLAIDENGLIVSATQSDSYEDLLALVDSTVAAFNQQALSAQSPKSHPLASCLTAIKINIENAYKHNYGAKPELLFRQHDNPSVSIQVDDNALSVVERVFTDRFIAQQRLILENQSKESFSEGMLNADKVDEIFIYMKRLAEQQGDSPEKATYSGLIQFIEATQNDFSRQHKKYGNIGSHPLSLALDTVKKNILAAIDINAPESIKEEREASTLSASCSRILHALTSAVIPSAKTKKVLSYGCKGALIGASAGAASAGMTIGATYGLASNSAYNDYLNIHTTDASAPDYFGEFCQVSTHHGSFARNTFTCDPKIYEHQLQGKAFDYGHSEGDYTVVSKLPFILPFSFAFGAALGFFGGVCHGLVKVSKADQAEMQQIEVVRPSA